MLETCGNDRFKIEINVDEIPTDIFANLNTYVTQKVGIKGDANNNNNNGGVGGGGGSSSPGSDNGGTSRNRKKQRK